MKFISTPNAPKPVAAYSQAVESNGLIYCSGQVGTNPETGKLVDGLTAQAQQIFRNLSAVLQQAGCTPRNVIKVSIYLVDLAQFAAVNAVYAEFVGEHRPVRTTVGVGALPLGALIEVDVIAEKN